MNNDATDETKHCYLSKVAGPMDTMMTMIMMKMIIIISLIIMILNIFCNMFHRHSLQLSLIKQTVDGSVHEGAAVLLPGFAIDSKTR